MNQNQDQPQAAPDQVSSEQMVRIETLLNEQAQAGNAISKSAVRSLVNAPLIQKRRILSIFYRDISLTLLAIRAGLVLDKIGDMRRAVRAGVLAPATDTGAIEVQGVETAARSIDVVTDGPQHQSRVESPA